MKKINLTLCLIFFHSIFLFSQAIKSDFKINQENFPSTIEQSFPKMFVRDSNAFILTWTDYRNGTGTTYAQRYDYLGNKIGINFRLPGNFDLIFLNDTAFISVEEIFEKGLYDDIVRFYGQIFSNEQISVKLNLGYAIIPTFCQTGWSGYYASFIYNQNRFISFVSDDGVVKRTVYELPTLLRYSDTINISKKAIDIKARNLTTNDYALFWIKDTLWNGIDGLYGNFYNSDDLLLSSKKIFVFSGQMKNLYEVVTLSDTFYYVCILVRGSRMLYSLKVGRSGNSIALIDSFLIPSQSGISSTYFRDINVSNLKDGKFYILATESGLKNDNPVIFQYLFEINQSGLFSGNYWVNMTYNTRISGDKNFFNLGNSFFIFGTESNKDVFTSKFQNFNFISSMKANDDLFGSNENTPFIIPKNESQNFIYYSDEIGWKGRFISRDGVILSEEKRINVNNLQFLNDGKAVSLWRNLLEYPNSIGGFIFFDENLNRIRIDTFKDGNQYLNIYDCLISYRVLDNSNILLVFRKGSFTYARLLSAEGSFLKEINLGQADNSIPKIFKRDQSTVIINWAEKIQIFDYELNSKSPVFQGEMTIYLGNDRYLYAYIILDGYPPTKRHYGVIKTLAGEWIQGIYFGHEFDDFNVYPINESYFMITYSKYEDSPNFGFLKNYYVRSYKSSGSAARGPILVHKNIPSARRSLNAFSYDNRIIFLWSDNRDGNFDIYASIFERGTITSVSEENLANDQFHFELEQNYPNPFNSKTKIRFFITEFGYTSLKIYDLLGRELAVLINEPKQSGEYEIEFDADRYNLSSGTYIYQLQNGSFIKSRKFVLIK